jgi:peptidyl-prolyl cis-trans isomerase B (cyclophilin B)
LKTALLNLFVTILVFSAPGSLHAMATDSASAGASPAMAADTHTKKPSATKKVAKEHPMSYYTDKVADIKTNKGTITIRFFPDVAPNHVKNFIDLAEKGFYNGSKFHRVIPGFMIQGGDPNSVAGDPSTWGTGGSGTNVKAEFNSVHHVPGIVSMARSQSPDSASSQFFIVVGDASFLDKQYSAFGMVTSGMKVADAIATTPRDPNDRPKSPVIMETVTIREAKDSEKGPTPK